MKSTAKESILSGRFAGFAKIKPIYETLEGWKAETLGITKIEDLPAKAREYVDFYQIQSASKSA
jgi:adenylosuccinate synthase